MQNDSNKLGTASNHYVSALYKAAQIQGLEADKILLAAGFSLDVIDKVGTRVPSENLAEFQRLIWAETQDEAMGHLPYKFPLGTYYMMGRLAIYEANLMKALELGVRFYNMIAKSEFIKIEYIDDKVELSFNLPEPKRDYAHLYAELSLLAWHRFASWLIADAVPLIETRFDYKEPLHVAEYSYLYPSIHKFNSDKLCIVFPANYLSKEVRQNVGSLKTFMNRSPLDLFKRFEADYSLANELKYLLETDLSEGGYAVSQCAEKLHMTTKTLMRRLKEEGTSFQQIKDIVRRDRAIFLLTRRNYSIQDIAEKVGYSDTAVFARAFKNWTADTPSCYRNKYKDAE